MRKLVIRAANIILRPESEWGDIAREHTNWRMHGLFLFYLGLHRVTKVPRRDAAECVAIVLVAGIMLSSVAGYYAGAAGLFPHM